MERVGDGIWAVRIPYGPTGTATNCYLFTGDDGVRILDPGHDSPEGREVLDRALGELGEHRERVADVLVTHLHADHLGMAAWAGEVAGVPPRLHRVEVAHLGAPAARSRQSAEALAARFGVPGSEIGRLRLPAYAGDDGSSPPRTATFDEGDLFEHAGGVVRAVHTPGHTWGSACLVAEHLGIIFTGDHVLPRINPGIGLGGDRDENPVAAYLVSLDRLAPYDDFTLAPGHGDLLDRLGPRRQELISHVQRRAAEVRARRDAAPGASVWEIASTLTWSDGWDALSGYRMRSALSQTAAYLELARDGAEGACAADPGS